MKNLNTFENLMNVVQKYFKLMFEKDCFSFSVLAIEQKVRGNLPSGTQVAKKLTGVIILLYSIHNENKLLPLVLPKRPFCMLFAGKIENLEYFLF